MAKNCQKRTKTQAKDKRKKKRTDVANLIQAMKYFRSVFEVIFRGRNHAQKSVNKEDKFARYVCSKEMTRYRKS